MLIPYQEFNQEGEVLHFSHANGYPPGAYRILLEGLSSQFHVFAMHMRPLWQGSSPQELEDWRPLAEDLSNFLDDHNLNNLIGTGHSMGATTTLRLALMQPERFRTLILIDPVIFPPWFCIQWDIIYRLGLGNKLHPLIGGARRRKKSFQSHNAMFENYRKKDIFSYLSDEGLLDYVESAASRKPDGSVELFYSPEWEAQIYATGVRADIEIWRALSSLKPPIMIIRGSETNTFWEKTGKLLREHLPQAKIYSIPGATHLVPLERPKEVSQLICSFLETVS